MARIASDATLANCYRLIRPLRVGTAGEVWVARDERFVDRVVEVEILTKAAKNDPAAEERRRHGIESVLRPEFIHPNAPRTYEYGESESTRFVVLEHVEGETLAERLVHKGPPNPADAARIVTEIAEVIQKAHDAGFVHGDLRAETVLVTATGSVKVLDLGLTAAAWEAWRETAPPEDSPAETGAPGPRVAPVERGRQADLSALGMLLYQMLAGRPFAPPSNGVASPAGLVTSDLMAAQVPEALARLCEQVLSPDQQNRPPSAESLASALRSMAAASPAPIKQETSADLLDDRRGRGFVSRRGAWEAARRRGRESRSAAKAARTPDNSERAARKETAKAERAAVMAEKAKEREARARREAEEQRARVEAVQRAEEQERAEADLVAQKEAVRAEKAKEKIARAQRAAEEQRRADAKRAAEMEAVEGEKAKEREARARREAEEQRARVEAVQRAEEQERAEAERGAQKESAKAKRGAQKEAAKAKKAKERDARTERAAEQERARVEAARAAEQERARVEAARAAEQERARVEAARAAEQDQIAEPKPEAGEVEPKTVHWGEHLFEHEIKPVQAERGGLESSRRGRQGEIASTRGMKKRLTQSKHGAVRDSQEARPIQKNAPRVPERTAAPKALENGAQDHWRNRVLAGIATGVIALTIGVGAVLLSTRGTPNPSPQIGASPSPSASALATASPATVVVPQVTGGSVSQARTQLLEVGLQFLRAVPTFGPPGVVVATDPSIGARVAPGSEVTLFVGTPPDRVGGKG